jgi:hypothetical protein
LQEYSNEKKATWNPTIPGTYKIRIHTKHKLSAHDFDDENIINYTVYEPATITSFTSDIISPQPINQAILLKASTNDDHSNVFKFLIHDGEKWSTLQDFSTSNNISWKPTTVGVYKLKVQVKHSLSNEPFDSEQEMLYTVYESAVLQAVASNFSQFVYLKSEVKITAKAKNLENIEYRFSVYDGSKWIQLQGYSTNNKLTWKPKEPGLYKVKIEIKHRLSSKDYDDVQEMPFLVYQTAQQAAVLPDPWKIEEE